MSRRRAATCNRITKPSRRPKDHARRETPTRGRGQRTDKSGWNDRPRFAGRRLRHGSGRPVAQSYKRKEPVVTKNIRFIGLDVHGETIAVSVAEPSGEVRSLGVIADRPEPVRRLVKKLGPARSLRACYEAGPCGYVLYWQLTEMGVHCEVVAPTLVPTKPGDPVKTDRRDALKLARSYRSGDLTPVWVPDAAHEALRDLVRAREAAKKDQLRARHRLHKFLLRHGWRAPQGIKSWTQK